MSSELSYVLCLFYIRINVVNMLWWCFLVILLLFKGHVSYVLGDLKGSDSLIKHCYHFPAYDFSYSNNIRKTYGSSPHIILPVGSDAIDFTLFTPDVSYLLLLLPLNNPNNDLFNNQF